MGTLVFTCPVTNEEVEHWSDDPESGLKSEFVTIQCPACSKPHFINRTTGKLLGRK